MSASRQPNGAVFRKKTKSLLFMKTNFDNSGAITPINQKRRGAALILVLSFLVLITALVIAFFTSVTTELSGAKQYAGGATAKQLADSAVQTVMGTIKLATSGTTDTGLTTAWASQPGMIRTYDTNGDPVAYYKLYSSGTMVIPKVGISSFDLASDRDETSATSNWSTKPALFTDLNSPLASGTGLIFPIVDGNNLVDGGSPKVQPHVPLTKPNNNKTYLTYCTNRYRIPDMEGFYVEQPEFTYKTTKPVSSANNPVPMPTKWIYVLRDGTLTAPDPESTTVATFRNAPTAKQPTTDNPITGRIAFWTDDETCKVNINTASAGANTITDAAGIRTADTYPGSYWSMPASRSKEDKNYSNNQPVNKEFQRYPGHPATTSLKPVFSKMWYAVTPTSINEQFFMITPRVSGSGSMGGTVRTGSGSVVTIDPDTDRLYASIDELMFAPSLSSGTSRAKQILTATQLAQSRFFITASSRAPDVNLFNKPRVCIWPISANSGTNYRTTFDNAFAFCSSSGSCAMTGSGNIYYFQRLNSDSGLTDLPISASVSGTGRNRMLMDYLHDLTSKPVPGFGGGAQGFQAKYNGTPTATDCDQVLTEIFDYIRCVNMNDAQLILSSSTAKTFASNGQVVPIQDPKTGTRGFGRFPTVDKAFMLFIGNAVNPPLVPPYVNVSGTNTENAETIAAMNPYAYVSGSAGGPSNGGVLPEKIRLQAAFFLSAFCPSQGYIYLYPNFKIEISGLQQFQIGPEEITSGTMDIPKAGGGTVSAKVSTALQPLGMPGIGSFPVAGNGQYMQYGNSYLGPQSAFLYPAYNYAGGNMGFSALVLGDGWNGAHVNTGVAYPFWGSTSTFTTTGTAGIEVSTNDIDLKPLQSPKPRQGKNIKFLGGPVVYKLWNKAKTEVVQTGTLNIPSSPPGGWPCPALSPTTPYEGQDTYTYDASGNFRYFVTGTSKLAVTGPNSTQPSQTQAKHPQNIAFGGRLSSAGNWRSLNNWILNTDVVRSVELASGDPRMAAARFGVPAAMYKEHAFYSSTTAMMAHSLRTPTNRPYYGATFGRLVNNLDLHHPGKTAKSEGSNGIPGGGYAYGLQKIAWDWGIPCGTSVQSGPGVVVGGSTGNLLGDWDNGFGNSPDGPYINKADEGAAAGTLTGTQWYAGDPYFESGVPSYGSKPTVFSPNRQIPSAVTFGSLPTGVMVDKPWQTLLFRPLPIGHPGLGNSVAPGGDVGPPYIVPPDHLFLDLFNMPVVEPYPISEPLSTAGRINMNYQIAPFTYINRDTGIRAVLDSERVIAIANTQSTTYKGEDPDKNTSTAPASVRFPINIEETLSGFTQRFTKKDIFRSPSEICSIHLVPQDTTDADAKYNTMEAYWGKHKLTGDNTRERPYGTIYPRLTTKSNTYTVHFRVQTLKKTKGTAATAATWDEKKDTVVGEYRGSQTIERYVDASDPTIPDYANPSDPDVNKPIDQFYKFRVIGTKNFTP